MLPASEGRGLIPIAVVYLENSIMLTGAISASINFQIIARM